MHNRIILAKAFFWPPHFSQLFIATKKALRKNHLDLDKKLIFLSISLPPRSLLAGNPSPSPLMHHLATFQICLFCQSLDNHFLQFKLYFFLDQLWWSLYYTSKAPSLFRFGWDPKLISSWKRVFHHYWSVITDQWSNSASRQWSPWPPAEGCFLLTPTASWLP